MAVVDRVNTTMSVWMGTTMGCAQCHTHKYDPITQEEYFRFFAILNNTQDTDKKDENPTLATFTQEQQRRREELLQQIAAAETMLAEVSRADDVIPPDRDRIAKLKKQLEGVKPLTTPILRELAQGQRRKTHLQYRGNYQDLGKEVTAGVPAALQFADSNEVSNRLALAKWLVDEKNPLTARVAVNRYWEQIFGIGLVRTSEDFGSQGELPSHPELLDWLATEFVASGWDRKALVTLMVTSAAYRQSSRSTATLLEIDPDNRLLARGPRFRMPAEVIRDQSLFVSGLLCAKMFGPPVRPPQPPLGLKAAFGGGIDWKTSGGEDRYRRAIYTTWRRSNPYPSMVTFGTPNRATMDKPVAALIGDLKQRGLLDETLIVWGGEFGRTPFREGRTAASKVLGRDHYPDCYTMWLAGGGVKAPFSYGATDELGFGVVENKVNVHDLQATILHLLGFDHERLTYPFQGRDFRLTDVEGSVVKDILA